MRDRPSRPSGPRARSRPSAPASPGLTRPAASRSGAGGTGAAARTSAPQPSGRYTTRAVVLGVVLLALVLSYVFPVRVYLSQQAEIAAMEAAQAEQRAYVDELAERAARWEDDDYIRLQARQRLYFGEPGEVLLVTAWEDSEEPEAEPEVGAPPRAPDAWWETLWSSVESANGQ